MNQFTFSIKTRSNIYPRSSAGWRQLTIMAFLLGMQGCATNQSMKIALTEMGTTSDSEYGAYGMRLMRSVNVTGLGAEEVVGTMTTDPDKWSLKEQLARFSLFRNDLPDTMSPRITAGQSHINERVFCKLNSRRDDCDYERIRLCNDGPASASASVPASAPASAPAPECANVVTIKDLTAIREALHQTQADIADAVNTKIKIVMLNALVKEMEDKTKENKKNDGIRTAVQLILPEEDLSNLENIKKLQDVLVKKTPDEKLNVSIANITKAKGKSGIIITNWERETALAGQADLSAAETSSGNIRKVSGFLILGYPRITSLQLGNDLIDRKKESEINDKLNKCKDNPQTTDQLFKLHRNYITHYQLRAMYVVFAESYQSAFQAALKADITKITRQLSALSGSYPALLAELKNIEVKINAAYASVTAATESGVLDATQSYTAQHPFLFNRRAANASAPVNAADVNNSAPVSIEDSIKRERDRSKYTLPVINLRSTLDDFIHQSMILIN